MTQDSPGLLTYEKLKAAYEEMRTIYTYPMYDRFLEQPYGVDNQLSGLSYYYQVSYGVADKLLEGVECAKETSLRLGTLLEVRCVNGPTMLMVSTELHNELEQYRLTKESKPDEH